MKIEENKSLLKYNTFGNNSFAKYFVELKTENDFADLITSSIFKNEVRIILGGGSNILFTKDFDGLLIHINSKGIKSLDEDDENILLEVNAGENWDALVKDTISRGYYGLENLALIPGSVGAAPVQNIGAYGIEQSVFFHSLTGFSLEDFNYKTYFHYDCKFEYRNSIFKSALKNKFIITKVVYKLNKQFTPNLNYKDLKAAFENMQMDVTARNVYEAVCEIRRSKLPEPEQIGNAGSFFKNPVVSNSQYIELQKDFPNIPGYDLKNETTKIPAGWLIEKAGLKGFKLGNAGVYDKHALILVNLNKATGKEILDLALYIKNKVFSQFKIQLEYEVNII